jgi:hypothetical protein
MPSTYSPELRIELIANGEQSGTWGATTNSNLGTLIESAISGASTVSITSANQALTALNGAADQARNAVIDLITTTTAPFSVYIPPSSKLYIVRNSSAYSATIYCSTVLGNTTAAGAGVVIPAGKTCILWTAGANVREQLNHIVGAFSTTDGVSVGGNLAVTGTSTFTGASTFTGIPSGPTAAGGTNTTQLATTAFVTSVINTLGTAATKNVGLLNTNVVQRTADNTVPIGSTWSVVESAGVLYFAVSGVNKAKLDASGNLTVTGNLTAYGTV